MLRFRAPVAAAVIAVALALGVAVAAPDTLPPGTSGPTTSDGPAAAPHSFPGCTALTSYLRARLLAASADQARRDQVPPPAQRGFVRDDGVVDPMLTPALSMPDLDPSVPGTPAPTRSRFDGTRLLALRGTSLVVVDLAGPPPAPIGRVTLPGIDQPQGLFVLPDHRALVIGQSDASEPRAALLLFDTTAVTKPVLLRTESLTGAYGGAWQDDRSIHVLVGGRPAGLRPRVPVPGVVNQLYQNWTVDPSAGAADLLPGRTITDGGGRRIAAPPLLACDQVWTPGPDTGLTVATVATLTAADGDALLERGRAFGVLSDTAIVHASDARVYLATGPDNLRVPPDGNPPTTQIFAFDATPGAAAVLRADATVEGYLEAMSATTGTLRVVTNRQLNHDTSDHNVYFLTEHGPKLSVTTVTRKLWHDQQVQTVRWFPTSALVLTSGTPNQNALYRIDFAAPSGPSSYPYADVGELDGRLITLGSESVLALGQVRERAPAPDPPTKAPLPKLPGRLQGDVVDVAHHPGLLVDRVTFPTEISAWDGGPAVYLTDLGLVLVETQSDSPCTGGARCQFGYRFTGTLLALAVEPGGRLRLAARTDQPGLNASDQILPFRGGIAVLTNSTIFLMDRQLRVLQNIALN